MIKENRVSKYMLYAIGEIVLVVIGILIALQINIWNEERKSVLVEDHRQLNLVEGLRTDSTSFVDFFQEIDAIQDIHEQLYAIGMKDQSPDSLGEIHKIRWLLRYHPVTKENDPLIVSKISDEAIRQEILNYFRMGSDLDIVYGEFENVVRNRMRIYLGEQGLYELETRFEEANSSKDWIRRDGLIAVSKKVEFQQIMFEANLKIRAVFEELTLVTAQNERLKQLILDKLDHRTDHTQQ